MDQGFRAAIERIVATLPKERQSLCFSATVPPTLQAVLGSALKKGAVTVNTVEQEEPDTHARVDQSFVYCGVGDQLVYIYSLLKAEMRSREKDFKVIIFMPTANQTLWAAEALQAAGINVLEIHSRRSQSQRDRASKAFREAETAVLLSSDVSARGVDYPDVSLVLQCGIASSKEQYVHRLGRTGRAGKPGRGVLLLQPYEAPFLRSLGDLPLRDGTEETAAAVAATGSAGRAKLETAVRSVDPGSSAKMFQAFLGFYNSHLKTLRWNKEELVANANAMATSLMALQSPPPILLMARRATLRRSAPACALPV